MPIVRAAPAARRRRPRRPLRAGRGPARAGAGMSRATTRRAAAASARVGPLVATPRPARCSTSTRCSTTATRGIIVCCGSGGVGKTTTSAALALRAAERGRKVVVLTIDPARRLAQSMGIEELDNTPRPVPGSSATGAGRLARRDDARHEAHLRRGGREPGQPGEGAADPGQPLLRRALELVRGHPGVHGDGEARPARQGRAHDRPLGPDRGRHPAVALRAGLPRRARAALELPRRPVHPAAARARRGARPG